MRDRGEQGSAGGSLRPGQGSVHGFVRDATEHGAAAVATEQSASPPARRVVVRPRTVSTEQGFGAGFGTPWWEAAGAAARPCAPLRGASGRAAASSLGAVSVPRCDNRDGELGSTIVLAVR